MVVVVEDEAVGVRVVVDAGEEPGCVVVVVDSAGGCGNVSDVQVLANKLVNSTALMSWDRMAAR